METLVSKVVPEFELNAVIDGQFKKVSSGSLKGKWTVLLFYPLDFTFVCPTELIAYDETRSRFQELNAQVFGVSVDSHFTHRVYVNTPRAEGGVKGMGLPLLADIGGVLARKLGILHDGGMALRGLFLIDPEGIIRHATINDLPIGRNVEETLRVIEAFQHFQKHGEVCPSNWTKGKSAMKPTDQGLREYLTKKS